MSTKTWICILSVVVVMVGVIAWQMGANTAAAAGAAAFAASEAARRRLRRRADVLREDVRRQPEVDAAADERVAERSRRRRATVAETPESDGEPLRSRLLDERGRRP